MYLGKVIGRVVCSVQDPGIHARTLLLVRKLPNGPTVVAVDAVGSGAAGETVYVCRGREAAFAFKPAEVPTEATIVGIVDAIEESPMIIARVVGTVVASQKHATHEGKKLLLLQPLDLENQPVGDPIVALDAVDAGVGDRVLAVQEGFSAMTSVGHVESPIDASVIGVIDLVELA